MEDFESIQSDTQEPQESNHTEPAWWLDKNTPGQGERPEWLPEKFKSLEDMSRSYVELEKRFGTAPNEYDLSKADWLMEGEQEHFSELSKYAKSKNVPQDVMDKMFESMGEFLNQNTIDFNQEVEKLGSDAKVRLERLDKWLESNFSKETFDAITTSIQTAEGLTALEELRKKMLEQNTMIPNSNDSESMGVTLKDLQEEMANNLEKYKTDERYRRDLARRMEMVVKDSPFTDKSY